MRARSSSASSGSSQTSSDGGVAAVGAAALPRSVAKLQEIPGALKHLGAKNGSQLYIHMHMRVYAYTQIE